MRRKAVGSLATNTPKPIKKQTVSMKKERRFFLKPE